MQQYTSKDYNFGGYVPKNKKESRQDLPVSFFSSKKPINILTSQLSNQKELYTRSIGKSPIFSNSESNDNFQQPRMSFSNSSKKLLPFAVITRNHKVNNSKN